MAASKITINNDGSIRVEGDFEICDPLGTPFGLGGRTVIGLCRCGLHVLAFQRFERGVAGAGDERIWAGGGVAAVWEFE